MERKNLPEDNSFARWFTVGLSQKQGAWSVLSHHLPPGQWLPVISNECTLKNAVGKVVSLVAYKILLHEFSAGHLPGPNSRNFCECVFDKDLLRYFQKTSLVFLVHTLLC